MLSLCQVHFDGVAALIEDWYASNDNRRRAEAHLDGLRIERSDAAVLATTSFATSNDESEIAAAALVLLECGEYADAKPLLDKLLEGNLEVCDAVRRGWRLALIGKILDDLQTILRQSTAITQAVVADVLAFHRCKVSVDLSEFARHEEPVVRRCAAEAAGRLQNKAHSVFVARLIADPVPAVRRSALRAAARLRLQGLGDMCRTRAVAAKPCLESIRFLAVCGTEADSRLLIQLTKNESTAVAAVQAMGGIGTPVLIPYLLELLSDPVLGDPAAIALERIAFFSAPRGDAPEPPPHASEEVLDFWNPPSPPIPGPAFDWWNEHKSDFQAGKQYQAGICVSENPLGEHFDNLPDEVRYDLYLRAHALGAVSVPDWELETWPQHERNPGWALNKR